MNCKQNIGMILESRFPPDKRVEEEAKSLIKAGFNVFLLCRKENGENTKENLKGINIRRVGFKNQVFRKINGLWFNLTFYHPFWLKEIKRFILENNINFLHIHDLPLLGTAIKAKKGKNIPILADLHENFPQAIKFYRDEHGLHKFFKSIFYTEKRWKRYEKEWLKMIDKIIVVVKEGEERIMNYKIADEKITIVSNLVDINSFSNIKIDRKIIEKYKNFFVVFYIGGFGAHRGIDCAIKSVVYLKDRIPNFKLVLVGGKNPPYWREMENLSRDLKINNYVEFIGWQPFEKVPSYIEISDICLVPYNKNVQTDASAPHKLFQYMLKAKPVLVSNCRSLKRVIEETKAGLVFQASDAKDLSDKAFELFKNANLRRELGRNGKKAVLEKYNWEQEAKKLIRLYKNSF